MAAVGLAAARVEAKAAMASCERIQRWQPGGGEGVSVVRWRLDGRRPELSPARACASGSAAASGSAHTRTCQACTSCRRPRRHERSGGSCALCVVRCAWCAVRCAGRTAGTRDTPRPTACSCLTRSARCRTLPSWGTTPRGSHRWVPPRGGTLEVAWWNPPPPPPYPGAGHLSSYSRNRHLNLDR